MSRTRDIAAFLGATEAGNTSNNALLNTASPVGLDSAQVSSIAGSSGLTVYSTLNDLPSSGLTSGDQAFVSSSSRFYISNGSGWYNVALINATPSLTIDPTGTITLARDGVTPTVITLTATDSDNPVSGLTYSVESDGSFGGLATISQDSSVFTITPFSEDSATTTTSTLTFKASDGVSFGSGDRTLTLTFKTENSNYTGFLVKADTADSDNQVDASTNALTITENGDVTSAALSPYHPGGYSTYFDGTGDYLTTSSVYSAVGSSSDFTAEAWIWIHPSIVDTNPFVFASNNNGLNFGVINQGGGFKVTVGHSYVGDLAIGSITIPTGTWTHIAGVRNSGTLKTYVNGVEDNSVANTSNFAGTINYIGSIPALTNYDWHGYIRDARFVSGTAVYTSAFTPPTESLTAISGTSLLVCHLPYIKDGSSNGYGITIAGNTSTKRIGPYDYSGYTKAEYGGSVYFDGNGDYLNVSGSDLQSVGSVSGEPFTIEFWYNYSAVGSNGNGLITKGTAGSTGAGDILTIEISPATRAISCTLDGLYSGYEIISSTLLKVNVWYHIALVKNSSNVYTLYINGKADGTYTAGGTISASSNFFIGTNFYAPTDVQRQSEAYFSDVRVVSDAVYTSNFTPPTAPLTAITNTELLTLTNKNDIWDASSGNKLTKSGDVTSSNTQRQFTSSSAIYFDGIVDSISLTAGYDDPLYNFGTHDWTLEGWFYIQNLSGGRNLFTFLRAGTNEATPHVYTDGTALKYYVSNADRIVGSSALTVNTWHHIASTRSGNDHKLFVDGTQVGSTWTNAQTYVQGRPVIGNYHISLGNLSSGTNLLHGYVQDFRITKGLARYTSAFTPPTVEFLG